MIAIIDRELTRALTAITGLRARLAEERGQGLMEYAVLGGVIAAFVIGLGAALTASGALPLMADGIKNCIDFDSTTDCFP